jgi:hypothetical protein
LLDHFFCSNIGQGPISFSSLGNGFQLVDVQLLGVVVEAAKSKPVRLLWHFYYLVRQNLGPLLQINAQNSRKLCNHNRFRFEDLDRFEVIVEDIREHCLVWMILLPGVEVDDAHSFEV